MPKLGVDNYRWTISRNNTYPLLLSLVIKSRSAWLTNRSWTLTVNMSRILINFHKINHFQKKWVKPHNYNCTIMIKAESMDNIVQVVPVRFHHILCQLIWADTRQSGLAILMKYNAVQFGIQWNKKCTSTTLFLPCSLGNTQSKINLRNNMYKSI